MRILVYARFDDKDAEKYMLSLRSGKDQSSMRNGQHWKGEIEKCDKVVYTKEYEKIGQAYKKADKDVELFGSSVKQVDPVQESIVEQVQISIQEPVAENIEKVVEEVIESHNVKVDGRSKVARATKDRN